MTVKYHLSVKGPNGELLGVQAEGEGDGIYAEFLAAVQDVSLDQQLAQLSRVGAAVAVAGLPARAIAAQPAQDPWGQPPVQPMQPQVPAAAYQQQAAPAAGGPACQHGQKIYKTGTAQATGREWKAWFCPASSSDSTQCPKEWIR